MLSRCLPFAGIHTGNVNGGEGRVDVAVDDASNDAVAHGRAVPPAAVKPRQWIQPGVILILTSTLTGSTLPKRYPKAALASNPLYQP